MRISVWTGMIGVLCLGTPGMSMAQAGAETVAVKERPTLYSYVSYWSFPQAQPADLRTYSAPGNQKILAAALADGTLFGYGEDENQVHFGDGFTHASWLQAKSIAGLLKMIDTLHRGGGSTSPRLASSVRHWDQMYITNFYNRKAGSWKGAYGYTATYKLKPDAPEAPDAVRALSSFYVPIFENMLSEGIIVEYEIDLEMIHTTDARANIRFSFVMPNAEGLDRFRVVLIAALGADSLIGPAFGSMMVNFTPQADFVRVDATYN